MVTSVSAATSTSAASSSAAAKVTSDYTTFLKMMTTQLQNQDPLSPMESSDFAVQLATFSGVEQQTKTNDLLTSLGSQFGVLGMAQLAGWVGQEARSAAPVALGDTAVTISYAPDVLADRAVLVSTDANGTVVGREDVPLEGQTYQWFGAGISGNPLPVGTYTLSLESYREGELIASGGQVQSYARILEARGGGSSGTTLILEGGAEVAATDITALRVP
jgi:flagellar basal-body rod modification protein FlgD